MGFALVEMLVVVAISVRLDSNDYSEFWDGNKWKVASLPSVIS